MTIGISTYGETPYGGTHTPVSIKVQASLQVVYTTQQYVQKTLAVTWASTKYVSKDLGVNWTSAYDVSNAVGIRWDSTGHVKKACTIEWGTTVTVSKECSMNNSGMQYAVQTCTVIYKIDSINNKSKHCIVPVSRQVILPKLNEECECTPPSAEEL